MDFDYTEDQKLLRDMVHRFGADSVEPRLIEMDEKEEIPGEILKEIADLGLMGLGAPEAFGGSGVSLLTQTIVAEELGRASASFAVVAAHHAFLFPALLMECGGEEQKSTRLPDIVSGKTLAAVAPGDVRLEDGREDIDPPEDVLRAAHEDGGWKLQGQVDWVVNGQGAGVGVLFAETEDGPAAFLLTPGGEGFSSEPISEKLGLRPAGFARWNFSGYKADGDARLEGAGPQGKDAQRGLCLLSDLFLAAAGVGLIQACIDVSSEYAKERKQFGRPIASFQLVQDLIAMMVFDVEAARLLLYRAALEAEGKGLRLDGCAPAIARARSFAAEAGLRAGTDTVQVHGGYGFSAEYPAERLFRDARGLALLSGGTGDLLRISADPVLEEAFRSSAG